MKTKLQNMLEKKNLLKSKQTDTILLQLSDETSVTLNLSLVMASENTLNEMIKCRNINEMAILSDKFQNQKRLSEIALICDSFKCGDYDELESLLSYVIEYKNHISNQLKKSPDDTFDYNCKEVYNSNMLIELIKNNLPAIKIGTTEE